MTIVVVVAVTITITIAVADVVGLVHCFSLLFRLVLLSLALIGIFVDV